ncbi:hypothetical protein P3T18_005980 [Paraburkholderia sp. GAS199]
MRTFPTSIIAIAIDFLRDGAADVFAALQDKYLCDPARRDRPIQLAPAQNASSNETPATGEPERPWLACMTSRLSRLSLPEKSMSQPEPNVDEIVSSIAQETDTPAETVSKMYADTLANYREEARVFDYVPLFAAKKVRDKLRHTSKQRH